MSNTIQKTKKQTTDAAWDGFTEIPEKNGRFLQTAQTQMYKAIKENNFRKIRILQMMQNSKPLWL